MTERDILRHCLAILAYRCGKFIRSAPASFACYDTGGGTTPLRILSHISDLLDWALSMSRGAGRWAAATPSDWGSEVMRFHAALAALDNYYASEEPIRAEVPRLLQGPIADALTHVGQIAMLRRMADAVVIGENYFVADIVAGRVGPEQTPPRKPFQ